MLTTSDVREVEELVKTIWSIVLNRDVEAVDGAIERPAVDELTGVVPISGAWTGAVAVHCPMGLARQVAGVMFEIGAEEVTEEQIEDALGELTNIVGGNFKTLLPGSCSLGLPAVASGVSRAMTTPGGHVLSEMSFQTADYPFCVTILEGGQPPASGYPAASR